MNFLPEMPDFHVAFRNLLHAVNLRRGTDGFTSPLKEGVLRIFFVLKNPTASAGFEPANLTTEAAPLLRCSPAFYRNVSLKPPNIT